MTVVCSFHGVVAAAADAPCPTCGQLTYDLDDRNARDVVRDRRRMTLKNRVLACGALLFVAGAAFVTVGPVDLHLSFNGINLFAPLAGALAAAFGARPLALRVERDPQLRAMDNELARRL